MASLNATAPDAVEVEQRLVTLRLVILSRPGPTGPVPALPKWTSR